MRQSVSKFQDRPVKHVTAIVLRDLARPGMFLAVRRPDTDKDLGGVWGLPAVTHHEGELPEDAARRVCREKLGCEAVPVRFLGTMYQIRGEYDLYLSDIEMMLVPNNHPDVHAAKTTSTQYVDQQWTSDPLILLPSAKKGSCCSSVFLTSENLLPRSQWVPSLLY